MSSFLKNLLGLCLVFAILIGTFLLYRLSETYDRSSEPTNFRSFVVSASGESYGKPDLTVFSYQVVTEWDGDLVTLKNKNAQVWNTILAYLKAEGVADTDIRTESYSINPRYENIICEYNTVKVCPPAAIVGYTVTNHVSIKIRDEKKVSTLLSWVVEKWANTVSDLIFSIDNPTRYENMARSEAIAKAKVKAQAVAEAGGFKLGRLLEISENTGGNYYYNARSVSMDVGAKEFVPEIAMGEEKVTINVTLKYEIL